MYPSTPRYFAYPKAIFSTRVVENACGKRWFWSGFRNAAFWEFAYCAKLPQFSVCFWSYKCNSCQVMILICIGFCFLVILDSCRIFLQPQFLVCLACRLCVEMTNTQDILQIWKVHAHELHVCFKFWPIRPLYLWQGNSNLGLTGCTMVFTGFRTWKRIAHAPGWKKKEEKSMHMCCWVWVGQMMNDSFWFCWFLVGIREGRWKDMSLLINCSMVYVILFTMCFLAIAAFCGLSGYCMPEVPYQVVLIKNMLRRTTGPLSSICWYKCWCTYTHLAICHGHLSPIPNTLAWIPKCCLAHLA